MVFIYWISLWSILALVANCAETMPSIMAGDYLAGPYVSVTDVKEGKVCLFHTDRPQEELPPECHCKFENLKKMEEKCALLEETAGAEIKMKCQELPCEVCCNIVFEKTALPGHGKGARLECVKKCPSSEQIMDVTESATPFVLDKLQEYSRHYFPVAPIAKTRPLLKQPPMPTLQPVAKHKAVNEEVPLKSEAEAMEERMHKLSHAVHVMPPPTPAEIDRISQENQKLVESIGSSAPAKHILSPFEEI